MRARFSAFTLRDTDFLVHTWDPETRPNSLTLDPGIFFSHLEILGTVGGGLFDASGQVSFRAHYSGRASGVQNENSIFRRFNGAWVYSAGVIS
jgi:Uncharacterized protein conserved in bacteria